MALMEATEQSALVFQLEGGDANQFEVLRYRGCEGLCQLYRFEIEVSCIESELDFDQIVGQAASLQVTTEVGGRVFRGIVSRFEHTGQSSDLAYFALNWCRVCGCSRTGTSRGFSSRRRRFRSFSR